jgi:hypothetical protein
MSADKSRPRDEFLLVLTYVMLAATHHGFMGSMLYIVLAWIAAKSIVNEKTI